MLENKQYISESPEETKEIAEEIAAELEPGDVLCMYGDLGAGKTAFVRPVGRIFFLGTFPKNCLAKQKVVHRG